MRTPYPLAAAAPLSPLILVLAAIACVPRRESPPPPAPPPTVAAAPVPMALGSDWRDWPLDAGTWTYRQDARGSIALFGRVGQDAALTLRCDRTARRLYLSRAGTVTAPVTLRTTSTTRALTVQPTGGTPPYVALALAAGDPLLDAMAFSRGRFVLEQAGRPPLVVPAWAEIGRVVEDCRG